MSENAAHRESVRTSWIFQGNPDLYDIRAAVSGKDHISWLVNRFKDEMKVGDLVYLWESGKNAGIVATGFITRLLPTWQRQADDPNWLGEEPRSERGDEWTAEIKIEVDLTTTPVPREVIKGDPRTANLSIITAPQGTNFRVTPAEQEALDQMVEAAREQRLQAPVAKRQRHYWIYSPGRSAEKWDEFREEGIMALSFDKHHLGDLGNYTSKEQIRQRCQENGDPDSSYTNTAHALWEFSHEMQEGDVVFAKRGRSEIVGRGVVESGYRFEPEHGTYKHVRAVRWTHSGTWEHPGNAVTKSLTDVTRYSSYVEKLRALVVEDDDETLDEEPRLEYPAFSEHDFLAEVFMSQDQLDSLTKLLNRKKNIILQGPPGVGKTFAARRLAWTIMGEENPDRILMVQFHQSYSYEDFIEGYRPTNEGGFELRQGPFYSFCKAAEADSERSHFVIIDEINRANLSKVFGELLMLIEADKRGEGHWLRLLYSNELFAVPENVFLIGTMNTADRSLALIDYALRRRFAFVDMVPAFENERFSSYVKQTDYPRLDRLLKEVRALNKVISEDPALGTGFRIGHSYFCLPEGQPANEEWLRSIVDYELAPLLSEYWFDDTEKASDWVARLRDA